jgi:GNAT superfamily N-acetyltransferase
VMSRDENLELEIRLARPNDAPAIASVLLESFLEYKALYTDQGFAATTPASQEVLDRLKEGPVWVAVSNGEVVGTASAVVKGDSLYVRGMAVLPLARGRRVGELLLEQIETYAVEQNCKRLFLSTTPFLDRAIRLYERFGFRRTDEGPHDLFGTPLLTMEKGNN